jgi:signal transduction histidine kinase
LADSAPDARSAARSGHLRAVPGGLGTGGDALALLQLAGEEVRHAWEPLLQESYDPGEVGNVIDWILSGIEAAWQEREVAPHQGNITLTRFLLERIGTSLLHAMSLDGKVEREGILALMRGLDIMRRRLEPDWDRYFNSQISGPDGLNMVTEVLHDLRSPLTSIRCLAELLERGQSGAVTDVQRKQLRLIYSAALGIGSMATDVIEMARQGDQVPDGDRVPFSISEVLEGVAIMVRPIAEEKGLRMVFQQLPSDQRIGMPHALGRVLLNLVTNALKFTDEGSVEVHLRATTPARVEFAVVDTGRGIPEAAVPHLFRPFRRSAGRAARSGSGYMFSGTGLGLALCRKLLRAMDSDLRYETTPGVGTKFFFELELPPQLRM